VIRAKDRPLPVAIAKDMGCNGMMISNANMIITARRAKVTGGGRRGIIEKYALTSINFRCQGRKRCQILSSLVSESRCLQSLHYL